MKLHNAFKVHFMCCLSAPKKNQWLVCSQPHRARIARHQGSQSVNMSYLFQTLCLVSLGWNVWCTPNWLLVMTNAKNYLIKTDSFLSSFKLRPFRGDTTTAQVQVHVVAVCVLFFSLSLSLPSNQCSNFYAAPKNYAFKGTTHCATCRWSKLILAIDKAMEIFALHTFATISFESEKILIVSLFIFSERHVHHLCVCCCCIRLHIKCKLTLAHSQIMFSHISSLIKYDIAMCDEFLNWADINLAFFLWNIRWELLG